MPLHKVARDGSPTFSSSSNTSLITLPGEDALVDGCRAVLGAREMDEPFVVILWDAPLTAPLYLDWLVGGREPAPLHGPEEGSRANPIVL